MAHVRSQLRDTLKALLSGSGTPAISERRVTPYPDNLTGDINIEVMGEQIADETMGDTHQTRIVMVRITPAARGATGAVEDQIDDMCVFVESAIAADPTLGGLAQTYEYRGAQIEFTAAGDKPFGAAGMMFAFTVYTDRSDPETSIQDM